MDLIRSLILAASSYICFLLAKDISLLSLFSICFVFPDKNFFASLIDSRYFFSLIYSTHGALHLLISYKRQGLFRLLNTVSEQLLNKKAFCKDNNV